MGGDSEGYLDKFFRKDYWRFTTQDNYAYHMGNVYEDMEEAPEKSEAEIDFQLILQKEKNDCCSSYFVKKQIFVKFLSVGWMNTLFFTLENYPRK
jgi:hypothetical protein